MLVGHTKFAPDRFFGLLKSIAVLPVTQQNDIVKSDAVIYSSWRKYCADDKGCEWQWQVMLRNWKSFLICVVRIIQHTLFE